MDRKESIFLTEYFNNECKRNEGNSKSALEHSNNCLRQDPLMKAEING